MKRNFDLDGTLIDSRLDLIRRQRDVVISSSLYYPGK
jgi:hypothetical protein